MVVFFFFFQAEDGIRDYKVTGVQTCALPISLILELDLGPERAPGGSRGPVLRPCSRTRGQIPGVSPGVVPVARAHAQPHPSLLAPLEQGERDRKSTRLNSSHLVISYAVFCLKKKKVAARRRPIQATRCQ